MAKEVSEHVIVVKVLKHCTTTKDSWKTLSSLRSGKALTKPRQQTSQVFQSNQAPEAQRDVLTHAEAEELHRRDSISLGMMRTLEFESRS